MIEYYKNLSLESLPYINLEGLICWEEFRDIPEYEGLYKVSDLGRIKSLSRIILKNGKYPFTCKEKLLKLKVDNEGYIRISLYKDKVQVRKTVHQLVATTFLNHTPCGFELVVNHINFIRLDNYVRNLEIVTQRENSNLKHIKSTSKFVGVCWSKKYKKWHAQIMLKGKKIFLGGFEDEIEASKYYQNALLSIKNGNDIEVKSHEFSSNHKGVCWDKSRRKWKAVIYINGKCKQLGRFNTEQEAVDVCIKARKNI